MKPTIDIATYIGILGLTAAMSISWTFRMSQHSQRLGFIAGICFAAIGVLSGLASYFGLFLDAFAHPPLFVVFVIPLFLGFIGFALSRHGLALTRHLDWKVLVGLQMFRLPLELLMLRATLVGIMPREFSMLGYNFDVLSGVFSILLFIYLLKTEKPSMRFIWIWNIFGMTCLLAIGILAVLTSPTVHAFGAAPEHINTWVLYFPYTYLPVLLVNFAIMGHVLATRKLLDHSL